LKIFVLITLYIISAIAIKKVIADVVSWRPLFAKALIFDLITSVVSIWKLRPTRIRAYRK